MRFIIKIFENEFLEYKLFLRNLIFMSYEDFYTFSNSLYKFFSPFHQPSSMFLETFILTEASSKVSFSNSTSLRAFISASSKIG